MNENIYPITVQLLPPPPPPLVWMFHSKTLNNKINKLHERALRIVYKNDNSSSQELLDKDNSVTIHHKNLQRLAVEMYKIKNHLSPANQSLPTKTLFTEKTNNYEYIYIYFFYFYFFIYAFFIQDDNNPRRVNLRHTFTTHTTLNTEQNQ